MRLRHILQSCAVLSLAVVAAPALAGEPGTAPAGPDTRPDWRENGQYSYAGDPQARDSWLAECRRRVGGRDNGVGGAIIGGLIGGVAGNRIAGRGNRTVGTVAGAAVGAAAGMAIDKAGDNRRVRDECETYLDDYYAYYAQAGRGYGYGHYPAYGYASYAGGACCQGAAPMAMVPAPRSAPECTETVEYVYEDVPVRPKVRRIPDKRVKVVPDKRIKTN